MIQHLIDSATGLAELGMFEEAETVLSEYTPREAEVDCAVLSKLLQLQLARGAHAAAARTGSELVKRAPSSRSTVLNTTLALSFLGREAEARGLLKGLLCLGQATPSEAYQMACLESRLGNFEEALDWLTFALRDPIAYSQKTLVDSDLRPLWDRLRNHGPTLHQAHKLTMPEFGAVCRSPVLVDFEIDANDLKELPERARKIFRFDIHSGTYSIHALSAADEPGLRDACLAQLAAHATKSRSCLRQARWKSEKIVLRHQAHYARLQLEQGNYLGARYHILWALGREPDRLGSFRADPNLQPLTYLLDEIAAAQAVDPLFCSRIDACFSAPACDASEVLDDVPEKLRRTPLYLLRLGNHLQASGDYHRALAAWLELCRVWPNDAVGFANGAACLMHLGLWNRAGNLLRRAPKFYRRFRLCLAQLRQLKRRDLGATSPGQVRRFRGQPDLGGLLREPASNARNFTDSQPQPL